MVVWGLSPLKKQCDFIMYGNTLDCTPEYTGNIVLAKRYGKLKDINAIAIFKDDIFEFKVDTKTGRKIVTKHEQTLASIGSKELQGAYAVYELMDGTINTEIMKLDILAFAAHPDDVELSASGTLLRYAAEGKKIGIVDLTEGELGTRGSVADRYEEAKEAGYLMGLHFRKNLQMGDGFFEINEENKRKIIEQIRIHQPEIVLANSVTDRHPDHGRAAKLVADACFYSGLIKMKIHINAKL
jgi:hypothetical protein